MPQLFGRWLRQWAHRCWPRAKTAFHGTYRKTDTVVFVHGIFAHGIFTWGEFPRLIKSDPDLPNLDCLLYCYPTGCVARHNPLDVEGRLLLSELQVRVRECDDIFLVGHSMGGLIILKGLVDRMMQGHAQNAPCHSIRWITLFASPLKGAWTAEVVRAVVGPALVILRIFRKHLHHLSRGIFVDQLIAETVNRIYKPDVSDSCNRRIPIRMILATRDGAVGESNRNETCTTYRNPQPVSLDEDHGSVKEPLDHDDARYRALSVDLQKCLTPKFRALCAQAIDPNVDLLDREAALCEITERYGGIIRPRIAEIVGPDLYYEAEEAFLLLMTHYAARHDAPPSDVANRSMMMLRRLAKRLR